MARPAGRTSPARGLGVPIRFASIKQSAQCNRGRDVYPTLAFGHVDALRWRSRRSTEGLGSRHECTNDRILHMRTPTLSETGPRIGVEAGDILEDLLESPGRVSG